MPPRHGRGAWWREERARSILFQLLAVAAVLALIAFLADNAVVNLRRLNIAAGFGFLEREASFAIAPTLIEYTPADSYGRALLVGLLNTLLVAVIGIVLATMLGIVLGLARLSSNWIVQRLSLAYVEVIRNTPLLLQLFVWWDLLRLAAPPPRQAWQPLPHLFVTNRGVVLPVPAADPAYLWMGAALIGGFLASFALARWARQRHRRSGRSFPILPTALALTLIPPLLVFLGAGAPLTLDVPHLAGFNFRGGIGVTPEFTALLLGLVVYTAAFIGEIMRSGILAVSRGQTEAALALGLSRFAVLRLVVLPQAVRIIIPPLTSEYLSLTKNSSLAVAIGFQDLVSIGNTTLNQTGQAIEVMAIIAAVYLAISLLISLLMNLYNRRAALVER